MEKENHWIEDWLSTTAESKNTKREYSRIITLFAAFCQARGKNFSSVVEEWRTANYSNDPREKQVFLDQLNDLIRAYATSIRKRYAPLSQNTLLTAPKSFFTFHKIPVDVELPRRACVTYHNTDLEKEQIRMILSKATERDRVIFLILAESGFRATTLTILKYWQIKEDFEKERVPMRILTPSSTLKDHVGDRWSFIGEDGFQALRAYLKPRLPLRDQDYVFASEKPGLVKGEQFTEASLSTKFRRITQHLKMEKGSPFGKPGHYRLHGLRKYFFNNMKAPVEYRDFWMGHSLGINEHYMNWNLEEHRKMYAQGYEQLRIQEPAIQPKQILEIQEQLQERDQEIQELRKEIDDLKGYAPLLRQWAEFVEKGLLKIRNPEKTFRVLAESIAKSESPYQEREEESPGLEKSEKKKRKAM